MEDRVKEAQTLADRNELLIWAAARGLLADAVELVSQGAEPNTRDKAGLTPSHYAASKGHLDMLQFLATKGVDLEAEDPRGRTALHYAAASGATEAARWLIGRSAWLDSYDAEDDTPLHLAARNGHLGVCKLLVARHADVKAHNKRGLTPLGEAVAGGWVEVAKHLVEAGNADVTQHSGGFSLLHVAAGMGQAASVKWLLSLPQSKGKGATAAGLDVSAADNIDGATALHAAALAGSLECVELLLQHGADASARSAEGQLPADLATGVNEEATTQLRNVLTKAAAKGSSSSAQTASGTNSTPSSAAAAAKHSAPVAAAAAAAAAAAPAETAANESTEELQGTQAGYAAQFGRLKPDEQLRRVDALARMEDRDIKGLEFLSEAAQAAVLQVRRARHLLGAFEAVSAMHRDPAFQEDVADPRVRAALEGAQNEAAMERYASDRQVLSVMGKLKKLHAVLRDNGNLRISLPDLIVPQDDATAAARVRANSEQRIKELSDALARCRSHAVDAIPGQPVTMASGAAAATAGGSSTAGATATGGEAGTGDVDGAGDGQNASAGPKSRYEELMDAQLDTPWKERMWQAFVQSSRQTLIMIAFILVLYGIMWYLGKLPQQQDPAVWQSRLQELAARQQRMAAGGAAAAQQGQAHVGWDAGPGQEL